MYHKNEIKKTKVKVVRRSLNVSVIQHCKWKEVAKWMGLATSQKRVILKGLGRALNKLTYCDNQCTEYNYNTRFSNWKYNFMIRIKIHFGQLNHNLHSFE